MAAKQKKRYVIYKIANRNYLGRVHASEGSSMVVVNENYGNIPHLRTVQEIEKDQVILDLGSKPHPGKVYGVDLEHLYLGKRNLPHLGEVGLFYKPKKKVLRNLNTAASVVRKRLKKRNLEALMDHNIYWHLQGKAKKYAGKYTRLNRQGTLTEIITFCVENYDASDYAYILTHELGHVMHYNYVKDDSKLDAAWMALYTKSKEVKLVSKKDCEAVRDLVVNEDGTPSQAVKLLDEEARKNFDQIIKQMKRLHNLGLKELDVLWFGNQLDKIRELWATVVPYSDEEPILNEYALKNYEELFAEAFAFYIGGVKLPKAIHRLMEKTVVRVSKHL